MPQSAPQPGASKKRYKMIQGGDQRIFRAPVGAYSPNGEMEAEARIVSLRSPLLSAVALRSELRSLLSLVYFPFSGAPVCAYSPNGEMEAEARIELANDGFANRCITTLLLGLTRAAWDASHRGWQAAGQGQDCKYSKTTKPGADSLRPDFASKAHLCTRKREAYTATFSFAPLGRLDFSIQAALSCAAVRALARSAEA